MCVLPGHIRKKLPDPLQKELFPSSIERKGGEAEDDEISEETVIAIAKQALQEQGVDVHQYAFSVWYRLNDSYAVDDSLQFPAYVIYLTDHADAPQTVYGIIIDPKTGDIQRFYTLTDSRGNG